MLTEDATDAALGRLLRRLGDLHYHFVTPTPATHARVIARRREAPGSSLADGLGWSLPFPAGALDAEVEACLDEAGALERCGSLLKSRLRVSSLHGLLFLHSAYPTDGKDAVFFGPDSYRFADLIGAELHGCSAGRAPLAVDIGAGAGVGGIVAGRFIPGGRLVLTDINPEALRLARINAWAAGVRVETLEAGDLGAIDGPIDLAIANPPYLIDPKARDYRDGGGALGGAVSVEMAREAAARLRAGGRLILYSGSAIVAGWDELKAALEQATRPFGCDLRYWELDPDVFGEELEQPAYSKVERIAAVAAVITRRR